MNWNHLDDEQPAVGEKVLVWHPNYGHMLCRFDRADEFSEAANGKITSYPEIKWWQHLPKPPKDSL